jgi:uncharacterized protein
MKMKEFEPLGALRNAHLMTLAAALWPRRFPYLGSSVERLFEVEPGTRLKGDCHWQVDRKRHPTLLIVHGLEGSSASGYVVGTAQKAYRAGFNVVRMNQRNCGGTEKLTCTLYNSGLSNDYHAIVTELIQNDGLPDVFAAGFSMGGNLVLKMAAEMGEAAPSELRGVVAICPALDLAACADAVAERRNFLYERHFVRGLKRRMRHKASLFPDRYPLDGLARVRSVREFDEVITARFCGFRNADDYYARSSARRIMNQIRVPTLIITAQDDPMVPFGSFLDPSIRSNANIALVATRYGGHCAFVSRDAGEERFWSEARIVEFCLSRSNLARAESAH